MSLLTRVRDAVLTRPSAKDWRRTLLEGLWLAPVLAALGWAGGFVSFAPSDPIALLRLAAVALIVPALGEELVFRVALLPPPRSGASLTRCALAIAMFVLWHPLQVLWFGASWAETVWNPWFLAAVAILGVALTRIYLASASVWPAVVVHWLVVVAWKAAGGASPWA